MPQAAMPTKGEMNKQARVVRRDGRGSGIREFVFMIFFYRFSIRRNSQRVCYKLFNKMERSFGGTWQPAQNNRIFCKRRTVE